eukprot:GHVU01155123.1.p3 GENE.GHVU01155123.1~~GHVU01155123.1.p3  ORF type:complete len:126 (+),score=16.68 GHVU01155123.1:468-845(+)
MPVCVECGNFLKNGIYKEYPGGNVRLLNCHACGKVADKYVEYDFLLLLLDLILQREQVYRHIVSNHMGFADDTNTQSSWRSLLRLALVVVLFDASTKWYFQSLDTTAESQGSAYTNAFVHTCTNA